MIGNVAVVRRKAAISTEREMEAKVEPCQACQQSRLPRLGTGVIAVLLPNAVHIGGDDEHDREVSFTGR